MSPRKKKLGAIDLTSLTKWKIAELLESVERPSIDSKKTKQMKKNSGKQVTCERKLIMGSHEIYLHSHNAEDTEDAFNENLTEEY